MFIDMKARAFMEATKCLNFTRAPKNCTFRDRLFPKNIASLEAECSMKLFYRDSRRNKSQTHFGRFCYAVRVSKDGGYFGRRHR